MPTDVLHQLEQCGQSIWTDVISREMMRSGTLSRYLNQDGITGVTANPAIFHKAIAGTHDYDQSIRDMGSQGYSPDETYQALAIEDVGAAADLLRPVYDRTGGADGYVSIEVSPALADNTTGTIEEARRFWSRLNRPNVMIKVPATPAGIPAIAQLTAEGINVNITLIFAIEVHDQVMDAYLTGLEQRRRHQQPVHGIASVASFFVSRVDTLVNSHLQEKAENADQQTAMRLTNLMGKVAIANAKKAYERFEHVFSSERFESLRVDGARVQRPLWASTSTKDRRYPDTMYVDSLIGRDTVNTMTLETIEAVRDHGHVECNAIRQGRDEAAHILTELESTGISLKEATDRLTLEGIAAFSKVLAELFDVIRRRQDALITAQIGD